MSGPTTPGEEPKTQPLVVVSPLPAPTAPPAASLTADPPESPQRVASPVRTPEANGQPTVDWAAAATGPIEIPRAPWTFVDVFAGLGVVLLLSVVLSGPLSAVGGPATLIVSTLPLWIGLIGTVIWACRRHGTGNLVRDLALRVRWIDLAIGLGAGLALRLVIGIWAVVYSAATGQRPTSNLEPILGGGGLGTGFWLVVNLLAIGVIGPVIEEIFFRGLGLRSALASLLRRADRPRFAQPAHRVRYAIAATSLIFALLHSNEINDLTSAVVLLPGLFLAGWVLGWLTVKTGRLGPGIVTHIVFNSTALLALLFLQ